MDLERLKREVDMLLAGGVNPKTKITRLVLGKTVEIATISRKDVDCIVEEGSNTVKYNGNQEVLIFQ